MTKDSKTPRRQPAGRQRPGGAGRRHVTLPPFQSGRWSRSLEEMAGDLSGEFELKKHSDEDITTLAELETELGLDQLIDDAADEGVKPAPPQPARLPVGPKAPPMAPSPPTVAASVAASPGAPAPPAPSATPIPAHAPPTSPDVAQGTNVGERGPRKDASEAASPADPARPAERPLPRPPQASDELVSPKAPPVAPGLPAGAVKTARPGARTVAGPGDPGALSEAGRTLAKEVAKNLPVESSFEFSLNLVELLAEYWRTQLHLLRTDERGIMETNYVQVLERAHLLQESGLTSSGKSVLDSVRGLADDLDADKVPYFAESLPDPERRFIQAAHDLTTALLHYKLAARVENETDRLVMLSSAMGATGCIEAALDRFRDVPVPEEIRDYAKVLELKIKLETQNLREG